MDFNLIIDGLSTLVELLTAVVSIFGALALILKPIQNFIKRRFTNVDEFRKDILEVKNDLTAINKSIDDLKSQNKKSLDNALATTRKQLLDSYNKILSDGKVCLREKQTLDKIYKSYCDLGGNSYIHDLHDAVNDQSRVTIEID